MAEFLSDEWIAELDAAVAEASFDELDTALTIEQRIHDETSETTREVTYHLVIEPTGARVAVGSVQSPDLTVSTDYETARALHQGRTTAQHALVSGRYKVRGRLTALRVLADLEDVFAPVRARTTFAEADGLRSGHDADG